MSTEKEFQARLEEYREKVGKEYTYSEYMENLMIIAKNLLGEKNTRNLKRRKIKSFEFDGIDVTTSSILATFPNMKERFNEDWTYYFNDGRSNPLEVLLQCAFHYGYDAGEKSGIKNNHYRSLYYSLLPLLKEQNDEEEK